MGIRDEDIVRVREASDLIAIASQHLTLKRVGRRHVGLCPFHAEKTPSFSVNGEDGFYYCFGCGAKGDVITFVREMEHLDFVGAVEWLANRVGITLTYTSPRESEGRKRRTRLIEVMEQAVDWYHERLLSSPDAAAARSYLRGRGLDGDLVRQYRLGWAPDEWDALVRDLDADFRLIEEVGLGFVNRRNRRQDAFRARILFPIFDSQGDPVAFGGRVLPGSDQPKYKNSSETSIYSKSKVLYGLNWAKADIARTDEAIVCEGYTDVIGMARAGMPRAVAPCGTALTEDHVRLLKRFGRRLVLAFDADAAGQQAAERVYEWERAHEVDVAVAALPPGEDPGDLADRDPEALRVAVAEAVPFLRFRLDRVVKAGDTDTAEGRARVADAGLAVIAEHPDELVRDQYLMELADACKVDPDRLRTRAAGGGAPVPADEPAPRQVRPRRASPEIEAIRLAVHDPHAVASHLDEALFTDPVALGAYRALSESPTLHEAVGRAGPEAADLLQRLAVEELPDEGVAHASDVIALLVGEALDREMNELLVGLRANADIDSDAMIEVGRLKALTEKVRPPEPEPAALEESLAWLRQRAASRTEDGSHAHE